MLRVYLDACVLNRLTDDPLQPRIALEAAAIVHIFRLMRERRCTWVASSILLTELRRNPDQFRREAALTLLANASETHYPDGFSSKRARFLHAVGYGLFDALHLALAENSGADVLVTTDDRFVRQAGRNLGAPLVRVENPLDCLKRLKP